MQAPGNASLMRIPYLALAYHTVQCTTRARCQIVHVPEPLSTKAELAIFTRAVELVYDMAEAFRATVRPE
eukprot:10736250-Alexandrium_andersonii.AAC.1